MSKLQTFLQDMDDFQSWLFKTQKAVASEDMPETLPQAEQLLNLHDDVYDDMDAHEEDYHKVSFSLGFKLQFTQSPNTPIKSKGSPLHSYLYVD